MQQVQEHDDDDAKNRFIVYLGVELRIADYDDYFGVVMESILSPPRRRHCHLYVPCGVNEGKRRRYRDFFFLPCITDTEEVVWRETTQRESRILCGEREQ